MTKPDFEKMADDMWCDGRLDTVTDIAQALRDAFAAGLERAAEIAEGGLGRTVTSIAAAIRAEKEVV